MGDYIRQLQRFNVGEDCPVFDGLFEFCQISASGSIGELSGVWVSVGGRLYLNVIFSFD